MNVLTPPSIIVTQRMGFVRIQQGGIHALARLDTQEMEYSVMVIFMNINSGNSLFKYVVKRMA